MATSWLDNAFRQNMLVCLWRVLALNVRLLRRRSGSNSSNCCEVAVAVADDITGEVLLLFSDVFCTCARNTIRPGALKSRDLTLRDLTKRHHIARVDIGGLAMSTLAIWCRFVQSRDVSLDNFDGLTMSGLAFSVAPSGRSNFELQLTYFDN